MTREEYRKELSQETDKFEAGQNCRLAIQKFFMMFPPKKEMLLNTSQLIDALRPLIVKGVTQEWADSEWRIIDIDTVKDIRNYAWWKQDYPTGGISYEVNESDCDDFAEFARSLWALWWKKNCLMRCKGWITYNGVNTAHAFDIVVAINEAGVPDVYLFDTEFNTEPVKLTSNKVTINATSWTITGARC